MTKKKPRDRFQTLTKREKEVLQLVCQHNSYQRIADKFGISRPTVKTHMHNIYVKLDLIDLEKRDERVMQIHNVYCPFFLEGEQPKDSEELEEQTKKPASAESELTEERKETEDGSEEIQTIPIEPESEQSSEDKEIEEGFQKEQSAPAEQVIELEFEPEPITPEEEEIIDGDEMALVAYKPITITTGGKKKVEKPKKKRGCLKFLLTLILGGLMVVGAWYTWNNYVKDIPIVQSVIQLINPDAVIDSSSDKSSTSQSNNEETSDSGESITETIIESILPETDKYADAYEMDDWAKQDDVWVRLYDYEVSRGNIKLNFEIWNKTGGDIYFSWAPEQNFSMTDNKKNHYQISTSYTCEESVENDERLNFTVDSFDTVRFYDDPLYDSEVTDLYITMEYLSKIDEAVFHINVGN